MHVAEWSKAVALGAIPFGGVGSNPIVYIFWCTRTLVRHGV